MTSEDLFLGGGSISGRFNEQSLPNIKGKYVLNQGVLNPNSVLYKDSLWDIYNDKYFRNVYEPGNDAENDEYNTFDFNASRSNSVYKDNANVRPNYYTVEYWIKYK